MFDFRVVFVILIIYSSSCVDISKRQVNPYLVSKVALNNCLSYNNVVIEKAIQILIRKQRNIITLFNKSQCYSNLTKVNAKDFPVIVYEYEPKVGNESFLKYPKCEWNPNDEKDYIGYKEYSFNTTTGTFWKGRRLIGFNNVWLGCPQDMCLNGDIDTIYRSFFGEFLIFRGRHAYPLGLSLEPNIFPIDKIPEFVSQMPEGYYDSSFNNRRIVFLIKGSSVWFSYANSNFEPNNSKGISVQNMFNKIFPSNVDSVLFQYKGAEERIYIFKDGEYSIARYSNESVEGFKYIKRLTIFSGPESVKHINIDFPTKIDAIIEYTNRFYIYSGWKYYEVDVNKEWFDDVWKDIKMEPKWVFKDRFHCHPDIYKNYGFGNYSNFIENYAEYSVQNHEPQKGTEKTSTPSREEFTDSDSNTLIIVIIITAIVMATIVISLVIVLVLINKRQKTNVKRKIGAKKDDLNDIRKFGTMDSKTQLEMKISEISMGSNSQL